MMTIESHKDFLCVKCGEPWGAETGKYPCPKGGQCDIPAARAASDKVLTIPPFPVSLR